MKKFLFKIVIFFLILVVIPVGSAVAIDPFNVFHIPNMKNNGIEPNKNYTKTSYVLSNPQKFDSFMFGSSRVAMFHVENIEGLSCYNMTCSAGTPAEHLQTLKTFVSQGIVPKVVFVGLDSFSYTEDPAEHTAQNLRKPYAYSLENPLDFWSSYLDPEIALKSMSEAGPPENMTDEEYANRYYSYGWTYDYGYVSNYDFSTAIPFIGLSNRLEETLDEISELKDFCDSNGIKVVFFTNPLYKLTFTASIDRDYLTFLERLAEITPYYNFSALNDITLNDANFIDPSHYNAEVSDILLAYLTRDPEPNTPSDGFGWYTTEDNVDELVEILQAQYNAAS